jgi:hypothetical protein
MSLTSCYSMPSSPASAPITMSISTFATTLLSSIYTHRSETFNEDFDAYVTLDIV